MLRRPEQRRTRMVDVDLLPQVAPPRRIPFLGFIVNEPFWIVSALGVVSLIFLLSSRATVNNELANLKTIVAEAEIISQVTLPKEVRDLREQLEAAKKRVQGAQNASVEIRRRQWPWSHVAQLVTAAAPAGVYVGSIAQEENRGALMIQGGADRYDAVLAYASTIKGYGLFSEVSVRSITAKAGISEQTLAPEGTKPSIPVPTFVPSPKPSLAVLPTATPTPTLDYIVVSQTRIPHFGQGRQNEIRGQVVDARGEPMAGPAFRISSCCPVWSAQYPREFDKPAPGTFLFFVGPGAFKVEILSGPPERAQAATQLLTLDQGPDEYFEWYVVFQKATEGPVVVPTPTPTFVPTPAGRPTSKTPTPTVAPTLPAATSTPTATATPFPSPTFIPTSVPIVIVPTTTEPASAPIIETRGVFTFSMLVTLKTVEEATR